MPDTVPHSYSPSHCHPTPTPQGGTPVAQFTNRETAREGKLFAWRFTVGKQYRYCRIAPGSLTQDSVLQTTTALVAGSLRRVADSLTAGQNTES